MLDALDDGWIDILTGHASARFKYVDVRDQSEFQREPPGWDVMHIPLPELQMRLPQSLRRDAEIVVFGASDEETEAAEDVLAGLGYRDVHAFRGGFGALRAARLI